MKITYLNLFQKRNVLQQVKGTNNKTAYAKNKNLDILNREIKIINDAHPILAQYGQYEIEQQNLFTSVKENEDKNFNQEMQILQDKYKDIIVQVEELMKEEIDIEFYKLSIEKLADDALPEENKEYYLKILEGIIVD